MPSKLMVQMRVTGLRAGIRVFAALDVADNLKTDKRCSRYLEARARALEIFHRKHPGAKVLEVRLMRAKESDHEW